MVHDVDYVAVWCSDEEPADTPWLCRYRMHDLVAEFLRSSATPPRSTQRNSRRHDTRVADSGQLELAPAEVALDSSSPNWPRSSCRCRQSATWPSHTARSPGSSAVATRVFVTNPVRATRPGAGCSARGWCRHHVRVRQRFVAEPGEDLATRDSPPPWRFPGVVTLLSHEYSGWRYGSVGRRIQRG